MKPKVRLKGFDEDWILATLKNIALVVKGEQINKTALSSIGRYYVLNGGIVPSGYTDSYNTEEDTISISEGGNSCGYVCYNSEKFWSGGHNYTLQNVSIDKKYLFAYLKGIENEIMKKRVGSGLPNIQKSALLNLTVAYPTNPKEQKAIGEFYSLLDGQIEFYTQQIYKLKQLKEASLISMFPQGGETTPRVRFKGFEGEWEKKQLEACLTISCEKNTDNSFGFEDVLSVSDEFGVMNQIELLGRSYAGKSVSNYGILKKGEIVYTKSPLKSKPYGIIKLNSKKTGIVSVLYAVYIPKDNVCAEYIHYYFSPDWRLNNYLRPLVRKGAKNTMNISDETALKGEIMIPIKFEEQQHIASYFNALDTQITLQEQRLEKLKQLKSACLDQMFV